MGTNVFCMGQVECTINFIQDVECGGLVLEKSKNEGKR
jgi:hypothetical protein